MARLKKTSVYLTQREHAALRHASRLTGRAQSDLIREGVRSVAFSNLPPANTRLGGMRPPPPSDFEIRARVHSVQEGLVATMYQLGRTPARIDR